MYLLDTDVLSEMRKLRTSKINANVSFWCDNVRPTDLFLSVVTLKELKEGVLRVERRDDAQGKVLRAWFEKSVVSVYRDRILPVTAAVARICAVWNVPDQHPLGAALIAATARVHGLKVVTRNEVHFARTGVAVINPWLDAP